MILNKLDVLLTYKEKNEKQNITLFTLEICSDWKDKILLVLYNVICKALISLRYAKIAKNVHDWDVAHVWIYLSLTQLCK